MGGRGTDPQLVSSIIFNTQSTVSVILGWNASHITSRTLRFTVITQATFTLEEYLEEIKLNKPFLTVQISGMSIYILTPGFKGKVPLIHQNLLRKAGNVMHKHDPHRVVWQSTLLYVWFTHRIKLCCPVCYFPLLLSSDNMPNWQ